MGLGNPLGGGHSGRTPTGEALCFLRLSRPLQGDLRGDTACTPSLTPSGLLGKAPHVAGTRRLQTKQSLGAQRRHLQGDVRVQGRGTSHAYTCPVLLPASAAAGPRAPGRIYLLVANVHLKNISSCTPEAPVTTILLSIIKHLALEALANASVVIILQYMNTASHHVHFKLTQGYISNTCQQKIIHF